MCACVITETRENGIYCVECGRLVVKFTEQPSTDDPASLRQELTALVDLTNKLMADHADYLTHAHWKGLPTQPPAPDEFKSLELRLNIIRRMKSVRKVLNV